MKRFLYKDSLDEATHALHDKIRKGELTLSGGAFPPEALAVFKVRPPTSDVRCTMPLTSRAAPRAATNARTGAPGPTAAAEERSCTASICARRAPSACLGLGAVFGVTNGAE